jgi:nucleotide-binding universal stress UspA family protein
MMITNKVLIPIDGSAFSLQVLPQLRPLLAPAQTELILLRVAPEQDVIELEPGNPDMTVYVDQREAGLKADFADEMLPQVRALQSAGFQVSTAMRFGDPAKEIERYIDDKGVNLVAMTTHGRTGLAHLVWGSVAEHVLRHARVPVMLYRSAGNVSPEQAAAPYN